MSTALEEIAKDLPGARIVGDPRTRVAGIAYDSRRVQSGDLFVCIKGFVHDGHEFALPAARAGAAALLTERHLDCGLPQVVVGDTRRAMGAAAATVFGHPSKRLRMIGVTGTNGKTTTTYLIRAVMREAGRLCGLIGTVEQSVGTEVVTASRTTPESADIQRLLHRMVASGCAACAMEVSSHGLVLHRTVGTEFDIAVFTNLTQDHFDFHHNFGAYRAAKGILFETLKEERSGEGSQGSAVAGDPARDVKGNKRAIINADDPHAEYFARVSAAPVTTYGLTKGCDVRAEDVRVEADGVRYLAATPAGSRRIRLRLTGRFNVYNSLAAIAVGLHEGIDLDTVAAGVEKTVVPGRFEPVDVGQDFTVIVDYAHTPDSLENVLKTARSLAQGRVICVVGAGGDRDRTKRPLMGEVAAELADYVVITSDNPRSEEPAAICEDVAEGVRRRSTPFEIVVDRREGIRTAINLARPKDLVLIAGKGHETYQEFRGKIIHFDDREEAAAAVRERMNDGTRAH